MKALHPEYAEGFDLHAKKTPLVCAESFFVLSDVFISI